MNDLPNFTVSNSSFITPENTDSEPKYAKAIHHTLSAIICFIGIVGNILVIIVTCKNRASKTAVHKYILNLAIADIGVLAICYPLTLVKSADPFHWPLGKVVCEVFLPSHRYLLQRFHWLNRCHSNRQAHGHSAWHDR